MLPVATFAAAPSGVADMIFLLAVVTADCIFLLLLKKIRTAHQTKSKPIAVMPIRRHR